MTPRSALVAAWQVAFTAGACAQPVAAPAQPEPPPAPPASPFSLQLTLDYTTAYFFHGIIQEDTGLILQPAAQLTLDLHKSDELSVQALLGVWNSFHGQKTGTAKEDGFIDYWYELDLIAGLILTRGPLTLTTTYTFYTSPSNAFNTVEELDFTLGFDDSNLLGKFALNPHVTLGVETGPNAGDFAQSQLGTYLELGIAPGFTLECGKTPIEFSFPVAVGLSLHDYYQNALGEDDTFGFVQVGASVSVPLPSAGALGPWTLKAGVSELFLGDHTASYNSGYHYQFIASVGVQVTF